MIDSVFRKGKNYCPQVYLEKYKYVVQAKKIPKYIIEVIEISSNSDIENSGKETSDEENSNEENFDEEN